MPPYITIGEFQLLCLAQDVCAGLGGIPLGHMASHVGDIHADEWSLLARIWTGLALQLLERLEKVHHEEFEDEMAKLRQLRRRAPLGLHSY